MSNHTWIVNQNQGGQFTSSIERITCRFVETSPITVGGLVHGIPLPGFEGTQTYPDEAWFLTANLSFGLIDETIRGMGFYADAQPVSTGGEFDKKRLSHARYQLDTPTTAGTGFDGTWNAYVWVNPPGVGKTQAFSIYIETFATGHGPPTKGFYPRSGRFTLERYRMGPWFKKTELTLPVMIQPP